MNFRNVFTDSFDFWQNVLLVKIGDAFLLASPCFPAFAQSCVVQFTANLKRRIKFSDLRLAWKKAKFTRLHHLFFSLCFNVTFDNFKRCAAAASHQEITWTPKMSVPQTSFNFWKLLEQFTSRDAFQTVDNFRQLVRRFTSENNVNVVNVSFNSDNGTFSRIKQRGNDFFQSIANLVCQNFATMFNSPNQVVCKQISRMRAGLKFVFHSTRVTQPIQKMQLFVSIYLSLCVSNQSAFIPHQICQRIRFGRGLLPSGVKNSYWTEKEREKRRQQNKKGWLD